MELYLSSDEYKDFKKVRKILEYHKIVIDDRNLLIVKVDRPLIGQKYGWGAKDIGTLYITNRFIDDRNLLEKLDKFPIHIHILIPKNPKNLNPSSLEELQSIAWASLYDNEKDAQNYKVI